MGYNRAVKEITEWKRSLKTRKGWITAITENSSIYTSFRALKNEIYARKARETAHLVTYFPHKQKELYPISACIEKTLWWHMSYKYYGDGGRQICGAQTNQPHWISKSRVMEKVLVQTANMQTFESWQLKRRSGFHKRASTCAHVLKYTHLSP